MNQVRAISCALDDIRAVLAPAVAPKADAVGKYSLDSLAQGAQCFKVQGDNGEVVAAYIVAAEGDELFIRAAAGRARLDLSDIIDALTEGQAKGRFKSIAFQTQRPGLVKKSQVHGYEIAGYVMRKKIK